MFAIEDDSLNFVEIFDEFPGKHAHTFSMTVCACGHTGGRMVSTTTRHRNFLPIMMCGYCGSLRANPYFTPETAAYYYENVYGPVKRKGEAPVTLFERQRGESYRPFLSSYLDRFASVLDYGGGAGGKTVDLLSDRKFVALHEVESDYSQAGYDAGLHRHSDGARYDLLVVSHVIEHLIDPLEQMREIIKSYAAAGGLILVATPILERHKPEKWLRLFHFAHKYYFNHNALIGLMEACGTEFIDHDGEDAYLFKVSKAPGDPRARYEKGAAVTAKALERAGGAVSLLSRAKRLLKGPTEKAPAAPIF